MIRVSVTGVELRRLLHLRVRRLEQTIEVLRSEAVTAVREREAENERAELFLKLFPPGDAQPDIYLFPRGPSAGTVGGAPPLAPRFPGADAWLAREIADHEQELETRRWMVAQLRECDVYELDREDLVFLGFGTVRGHTDSPRISDRS